jgi:hypothetical protein
MDAAVQRLVADGVTVTVAAGNESWDACEFSPGRTPSVITVGSTRRNDIRSGFSNFGTCVDLFAPGSGITSSWYKSNTATRTISGTSMASPHVAGAAALYLQAHRSAKPEQVKAVLLDATTTGTTRQRRAGSPDRLLFSRVKAPPPNNLIRNGGFESGPGGGWSASAGVITDDAGEPAYTGSWKAWLGGTGTDHTDTLAQQVRIPRRSRAELSFYLRINTNEGTAHVADSLAVQVVAGGKTRTLAVLTNRKAGLGMVRRTYDLSGYAGKAVTIRFVGDEDAGAVTNFVVDQVGLATRRR